jgi:defect in organelle trafficking protein DotD
MEEIGMDNASLRLGATLVMPFATPARWECREGSARHLHSGFGVVRPLVTPILAWALLTAGCAVVQPVPTDVGTPGMANPEEALQRSMHHVDAEMAELGQLSPAAVRAAHPVMPEDLQRIVSFDWRGSLDQAVAKLAAGVGYTFYMTAPVNAQALDVVIRLSSVPAYQVFEALGAEAGARATVEVDPLHHQVEVIHHV